MRTAHLLALGLTTALAACAGAPPAEPPPSPTTAPAATPQPPAGPAELYPEGCPLAAQRVVEPTIVEEAATLEGIAHRVSWRGELNDDGREDVVLIEEESGSLAGQTYRVLVGCGEGRFAVVLDDVYFDLGPLEGDGGFRQLRALNAQMDGSPPVEGRLTLDPEVGEYRPDDAR